MFKCHLWFLFKLRKCKTRLAKAYSNLGLHKEAVNIMTVIRNTRESIHERNPLHLESAAIQRTSAEILLDYLETGEITDEEDAQSMRSQAQGFLKTAESITIKTVGEGHLHTALIRKEMARVLLMMGEYKEAYKKVTKSLVAVKNACQSEDAGCNHYLVADIVVLKSDVELKLGLNEEHSDSLQSALKHYKKEFGDNHISVAKTLLKQCYGSFEAGRIQDATNYFMKSEEVCGVLKEDLRKQIEDNKNKVEVLRSYKLDRQFPLFKFQRKIELMQRKHKKPPGVW